MLSFLRGNGVNRGNGRKGSNPYLRMGLQLTVLAARPPISPLRGLLTGYSRGRISTFVNKRLRLRIKIDDAMTDAKPPLRFLKNSFATHKAVWNLS